jgi:hypothetical protein
MMHKRQRRLFVAEAAVWVTTSASITALKSDVLHIKHCVYFVVCCWLLLAADALLLELLCL